MGRTTLRQGPSASSQAADWSTSPGSQSWRGSPSWLLLLAGPAAGGRLGSGCQRIEMTATALPGAGTGWRDQGRAAIFQEQGLREEVERRFSRIPGFLNKIGKRLSLNIPRWPQASPLQASLNSSSNWTSSSQQKPCLVSGFLLD